MNVVDTNIWIYCHDGRDPTKRAKAQEAVAAAGPLALPWQVGCEFIAACRKLEPQGFDKNEAWDSLTDISTSATQILLPVPDLWPETRSLQDRFSLSFWDALLVATCIRGNVKILYTENMGAPRTIDNLSLVNPFLN